MRYEIWSNMSYRQKSPTEGYSQFIDGYRGGAPMLKSWEGELPQSNLPVERKLEQLFAMFNRDDRPNGRIVHSLSVGDAVVLDDGTSRTAFAVQPRGFAPITASHLDENQLNPPATLEDVADRADPLWRWKLLAIVFVVIFIGDVLRWLFLRR